MTDNGYLVPSLVAARQLIERNIHEIADIVIFTVDVDRNTIRELSNCRANSRIKFEPLTSKLFVPPEGVIFRKSHITVTALARLCLHEVIPQKYENIVYLDGDVQIVGDISPLVRYRVQDQKLLAARACAWLTLDGYRNDFISKDYLEEIGGIAAENYFSSGVLAVRRATWLDAAPKALQFFMSKSKACILYDQSALNAIFKNNVLYLSPKFNFQDVYSELYVQRSYPPALIHFSGTNKPWHYVGPPWGYRFHQSYIELLREHPSLSQYLKGSMDKSTGRRIGRSSWSRLREGLRIVKHRNIIRARRKKFFDYVRETEFAV